MRLHTRDRWLCAAVPALLLLVVYAVVVARPARRRAAALRAELAAVDPVETSAARLERARAEGERAQAALRLLREQDAALPAPPADPAGDQAERRMKALREISRLCEASGLTLLGSTPEDGARAAQPSPAVLERLGKAGWPGVAAWRLDLRGSYGAMVRLLDALAASDLRVLPADIVMEPSAGETGPIDWVLILWL